MVANSPGVDLLNESLQGLMALDDIHRRSVRIASELDPDCDDLAKLREQVSFAKAALHDNAATCEQHVGMKRVLAMSKQQAEVK